MPETFQTYKTTKPHSKCLFCGWQCKSETYANIMFYGLFCFPSIFDILLHLMNHDDGCMTTMICLTTLLERSTDIFILIIQFYWLYHNMSGICGSRRGCFVPGSCPGNFVARSEITPGHCVQLTLNLKRTD